MVDKNNEDIWSFAAFLFYLFISFCMASSVWELFSAIQFKTVPQKCGLSPVSSQLKQLETWSYRSKHISVADDRNFFCPETMNLVPRILANRTHINALPVYHNKAQMLLCLIMWLYDCERTDTQNGNTYDSIQRVEEEWDSYNYLTVIPFCKKCCKRPNPTPLALLRDDTVSQR